MVMIDVNQAKSLILSLFMKGKKVKKIPAKRIEKTKIYSIYVLFFSFIFFYSHLQNPSRKPLMLVFLVATNICGLLGRGSWNTWQMLSIIKKKKNRIHQIPSNYISDHKKKCRDLKTPNAIILTEAIQSEGIELAYELLASWT